MWQEEVSRSSEMGGFRESGVYPIGVCLMNVSDSTIR